MESRFTSKSSEYVLEVELQMPEKNDELKELRSIKRLLVLMALRSGASSEDVDAATGMGAGNIRAMFPTRKRDKKDGPAEPAALAPVSA